MDALEAKIRCMEIAAKFLLGGDDPVEAIAKAGRTLYDSTQDAQPAPKPGTLTVPKKDSRTTI